MTTITATTPPRSHGGQIKRLLFSFLIGTSIASASVLDAIAQVESGGNSRAVGDAGKARGAWQMHRAAWEQSVRRLGRDWPFDHAHQLDKARLVAAEHLRWLTSQFESRTGRKASAADQYALWNLGLNGYARRNWKLSACPTITRNAVTKLTTYLR